MQLLTPPTAEPVTLAEAKAAARVSDTTVFDAQLPGLIAAARQMAEQETGVLLMQQTWRIELADWPASTDVLPLALATAAAVSYWSGSAWVSLSGGAFEFAQVDTGTALAPVTGTSWPTLGARAIGPRVRIDLTAGATDAANVRDCVKLYIKALVAWWIDNPSAMAAGNLQEAPFLRSLLDPVRLWGAA